jgi:pilus assembly protein CpaC
MSAAILFAASAVSAQAAPVPYVPSQGASMRVTTQSAPVKTQVLNLAKGRSAVIDLPADASDVFVSNPAVADAVLRTPRRIFVLGVAPGQSDAIFFDGMGRQILNLSIHVEAPTDNLADTVHRLFPQSQVDIQSLNGHLVLSGIAQNAGEADEINRLAQTYVDKPENVVNLISIAGKDQVTLKVRIVEVNRNTIKQLGLGTSMTYNFGTRSYSFLHKTSYDVAGKYSGTTEACYDQGGTSASSATGRTLSTGSDTTACLEAFEQVGLARTLAEPNLTAISGESAKFLAGGEFPVPVGQDNQGRVTVEFKPFGVGLGFTPVVTSNGRISMRISTEVSELTNVGALALSSSLTIPGLTVRRAETTVEMQSGSSLMIAGLLESKYKQVLDSLPGLTTLPVLGSLFRSRDFLHDETELVVIVTPYVVSPTDPNALQTPADNLALPSDMSSVFMGNLNKVINKTADSQQAPAAPAYRAPIGYVIE